MENNYLINGIIDYIEETSPRHAKKLRTSISELGDDYFARSEKFYNNYQLILKEEGKSLNYGADNYMRMINDVTYEQVRFMQSGRYSCQSFADAYEQVYSKPDVMEYYMSGLIMSQFLWKHHYEMVMFFVDNLKEISGHTKRHLEVGGGHGINLLEAIKVLGTDVHYDLIDISESSIQLAKKFLKGQPVNYFLQDVYEYFPEQKYDSITMGEVLEHVEEPVKLLEKLKDLLSENGKIFITAPGNAAAIDHIYLFESKQDIIDTAHKAGLRVVKDLRLYSEEEVSEEFAIENKVPFLYGAFLEKDKTSNN